MPVPTFLPSGDWRALEATHEQRVDAATAGHRRRSARGERHPVEDFLFTYYRNSVAALRRWHPGQRVALAGAADRGSWRHYRADGGTATVDVDAYLAQRRARVASTARLLRATLDRPAQLACFGLHEWAMVHRLADTGRRHPAWPLRLGTAGTDEVVETHRLACTHLDAYRFFTPSARPRNALHPTRERQAAFEQPGCLHAGMDCYRWAYELSPVAPSDLVADAFDLARDIRVLDMRASPYDLRDLGYEPVCVETPAGKAAYVAGQRALADRAQDLRRRLLEVTAGLLSCDPTR